MRSKKFRSTLITFGIVVAAFIACQVMISTGAMTRSLKGQLVPICAYIVMAVSLNLTVGISGELSLGHAGFMSVGAFSGIVMAMWLSKGVGLANETVCLLLAILTGGVAAGIAGVLIGIPVLRLRGDYLAIVTLAFGEIIRNVINCLYISLDGSALHIAFNNPNVPGKLLVNGPAGATGVTKIATFGMGFVLVLFTLFVVLNLIDSRSGRAIMAIRDNRIAAEAMGLNVTKYKMMAFVTSAVLAGMAGALLMFAPLEVLGLVYRDIGWAGALTPVGGAALMVLAAYVAVTVAGSSRSASLAVVAIWLFFALVWDPNMPMLALQRGLPLAVLLAAGAGVWRALGSPEYAWRKLGGAR